MVDEIPIVVMTGTDDRTLAAAAMRSGAQDYLVKGAVPGSAIARVLQYAIDRFHFHRELIQRDNLFREIVSRVPAIIWTTNVALEIKSVIGAGLQRLELDPQQIVGKTLEEYFRLTSDAEGTVRAHQRALDGPSVAFETAWLGARKKGTFYLSGHFSLPRQESLDLLRTDLALSLVRR